MFLDALSPCTGLSRYPPCESFVRVIFVLYFCKNNNGKKINFVEFFTAKLNPITTWQHQCGKHQRHLVFAKELLRTTWSAV